MKYFLLLFLIFSTPAIATPCESVGIASAAIANAKANGESFYSVLDTVSSIKSLSDVDKSFYIAMVQAIYKNNIDAIKAYDIGFKACSDIIANRTGEEVSI